MQCKSSPSVLSLQLLSYKVMSKHTATHTFHVTNTNRRPAEVDRSEVGGGESAECLTSARGSMAGEQEQLARLCGTRPTGKNPGLTPSIRCPTRTSATMSDEEVIKESRHGEEGQEGKTAVLDTKDEGHRGNLCAYRPTSASWV